MAKYQVGASTYEVPDGIPQEQLTSILTELASREQSYAAAKRDAAPAAPTAPAAPKQERSTVDEFGRQLGLTARHALEGSESAITYPVRAVAEAGSGIANFLGANDIAQKITNTIGMGGNAGRAIADKLGLPTPEGDVEKAVGGATKALAGVTTGNTINKVVNEGVSKVSDAVRMLMPTAKTGTDVALNTALGASGELAPTETAAGTLALTAAAAAANKKLNPNAKIAVKDLPDEIASKVPLGKEEISSKAAQALEKLTNNPESVSSDVRVRELFLAEKARAAAANQQRKIVDDEVFKNVGDKLKHTANQTVESLVKAGELDSADAKEVKAVISRAARHNRAITGNIKDEELAGELARGFRTDDAIIDALNISGPAKDAVKNAVRDLDTVTFNSLKKNQGGVFQTVLGLGGKAAGDFAGAPGVGRAIGQNTGRFLDKLLLQSGTAPVLKRSMQRLAEGLDETSLKVGDTVGDLEATQANSIKAAAAKALAQKQAQAATAAENLKLKNEVLKETGMPLSGAFQELLPGGKSGLNLSTDEAVDALRKLAKIGGKTGEGAKAILKSPDELLPDPVFYGIQNKLRKLQEKGKIGGTPPVKNQAAYNAKVIENTLRDILAPKGE